MSQPKVGLSVLGHWLEFCDIRLGSQPVNARHRLAERFLDLHSPGPLVSSECCWIQPVFEGLPLAKNRSDFARMLLFVAGPFTSPVWGFSSWTWVSIPSPDQLVVLADLLSPHQALPTLPSPWPQNLRLMPSTYAATITFPPCSFSQLPEFKTTQNFKFGEICLAVCSIPPHVNKILQFGIHVRPLVSLSLALVS